MTWWSSMTKLDRKKLVGSKITWYKRFAGNPHVPPSTIVAKIMDCILQDDVIREEALMKARHSIADMRSQSNMYAAILASRLRNLWALNLKILDNKLGYLYLMLIHESQDKFAYEFETRFNVFHYCCNYYNSR